MENQNLNEYEEVLETLYPGYSTMSDKKKELIQMRSFDYIRYSKEIMALIAEMKNQESPLYQENANDKDLINIAYVYSKIIENSQRINKPTGKVVRSEENYDMPKDELKNVKATDSEQNQSIALAIEEYNSKNKIRPKNLIKMLTQKGRLEINLNAALEAKKILDALSSRENQALSLGDNELSDVERG